MTKELVSLVGAVVSGGFALAAVVITRRGAVRDRTKAADELAMRYRVPLLQSAFDLQTRLYNIGAKGFLGWCAAATAPESQREYAIGNTLYLVAQYLCFSEIIRRGTLFLDPVDRHRQRAFTEAMEKVRDTFATTDVDDPALRLFRGEQRALGEVMLIESAQALPGAPRWDCLGYAAFMKRLEDPEMSRWFRSLRSSIDDLAADPDAHRERLVRLQHALLDVVGLIDPNCDQVTGGLRERL